MKLYAPEECMQWVERKSYYENHINNFIFQPKNEKNQNILTVVLADMCGKMFHHNIKKIEVMINEMCNKYPQLDKILDEINIYMCPYPSIGFQNAEVWNNNSIIFYPRTTQIPSLMTNYIVVHEFGHVIQGYLCKDRGKNSEKWREYLKLRNAPYGVNENIYLYYDEEKQKSIYGDKEDYFCLHSSVPNWDDKPTEWFAEDFRYYINIDGNQQWELTTIDKPREEIFNFIEGLK